MKCDIMQFILKIIIRKKIMDENLPKRCQLCWDQEKIYIKEIILFNVT